MPILMILKAVFSPRGLKFLLIGAAAVAVVGGLVSLHSQIWQAGYDKAVLEMQSDQLAAIERAVEDAKRNWIRSNEVANAALEQERKLREVTNELTSQIPKVAADSQCSHLGPEFLRVFNAATQGGRAGDDADTSGISPAGVP